MPRPVVGDSGAGLDLLEPAESRVEQESPRDPGSRAGGCFASVREFAARAGGRRHAPAWRHTRMVVGGRGDQARRWSHSYSGAGEHWPLGSGREAGV